MKKILVTVDRRDFDPEKHYQAESYLKEHGFELDFYEGAGVMSKEEVVRRIGDYDALLGWCPFDEEVAEAAKKLKIYSVFAVGYDMVDLDAARRHEIVVANARALEHSHGVAELSMALLLSAVYGITSRHNAASCGDFTQVVGEQLYGKTLGLMGFGWIAQRFARIVQEFGVKVIAYDVYQNPQAAFALDVIYVSFEELLAQSDIISLHVPGGAENYHLFNDEIFAKMKEGSYFINTSRGTNVDENALYRALKSGHLKAAAVDVIEGEGNGKQSPLFELPNFTLTPHIGGHNVRARNALAMCCARSIVDVFEGRKPQTMIC